MALASLVGATDLVQWADRRDAQGRLPLLVRRLIHATARGITKIHFPAEEGVQLPGWDGALTVVEGNAFVPSGESVWELGTGNDPAAKANADYVKRSAAPGAANPAETTFVFATLRRWPGKEDWAAAKRREGPWRDVRVLDADDLEHWFDLAPAVHVWISVLLGRHAEGARDLASYWEDWAAVTQPALSADLLLAGREKAAEQIGRFAAAQSATTLALRCDSREEAIAVFAAVVQRMIPEDRVAIASRSLVVSDEPTWQHLVACPVPLLLVPLFDSATAIAGAVRRGHSVLVPLGRGDEGVRSAVDVPRIARRPAHDALIAMGVARDRAGDLAGLARRGMTSLRRRLAAVPVVKMPEWARPEHARGLIPVVLAGAWNAAKEGDREVIAGLAQSGYEAFAAAILKWSRAEDPPLRKVGDVSFAVSREDLWTLIGTYLTADDMARFAESVQRVLGSPDPRFDLDEDKRWMAGVLGHTSSHSSVLREGLASTLAIMGVFGEAVFPSVGRSARDWAESAVRALLERANQDWRIWASLSDVLPRLAEAAPDIFLASVEAGLVGDQPVIARLFAETKTTLFSSSPHTGLLWALEVLAWHPDFLGATALRLARLAAIDPGGQLANRPMKSLREIFLGWHPQTTASLDQRIATLDLLRAREPAVAWDLLCELLPELHGVAFSTATPRFADWAPEERGTVTNAEYRLFVQGVTERLLADAGQNGDRWRRLIDALEVVPPEKHEAIVARLEGMDVGAIDPAMRVAIWSALREQVGRHRAHPTATWALAPERVNRIDALRIRFEPDDAVVRSAWLFAHWPDLLTGGFGSDIRAWEAAASRERITAVRAVHQQQGLAGIHALAGTAPEPFFVGMAFGETEVNQGEADEILARDVGSGTPRLEQLGAGFVASLFRRRGWEWARTTLAEQGRAWEPQRQAAFLASLPHHPEGWDLAAALGGPVDAAYWRRRGGFPLEIHAQCLRAAAKLLEHGRALAAVHVLALYGKDVPGGLDFQMVLRALEGAIQEIAHGQGPDGMFGYNVAELMTQLEGAPAVDEGDLARLEWAYLPLLDRHDRAPKVLHRELSRNPAFFTELVTLLYRAEGEERRDLTDGEQARWRAGNTLLESWRGVPGTGDDGALNGDALQAWVADVRRDAQAAGRGAVGDMCIGKVLSNSPPGPNGEWPHPAVRDAIERASSDELENGFEVAVYNSRGVVTKDPADGGGQERTLVDRYERFAAGLGATAPRTAAMLRRIADGYRRDAAREDADADLRQDLWG